MEPGGIDGRTSATTMSEPRHPIAVLYVDDEDAARQMFARLMARRGFEIDTAASAAEAERLAALRSYKVIVTDLRMPGVDGLSLVRALKPRQGQSAFVIVTGLPDVDVKRGEAGETPFDAIVPKPWNADELEGVLRKAAALAARRTQDDFKSRAGDFPRTLLLIEDDEADAQAVQQLLLPTGCEIVVRGRLSDGLAELRGRKFEVVMVDLVLPDARGVDEIVRLQLADPETAIVALGPVEDEATALKAMHLGAQDYLCKHELDARTLRKTIRYAVERKRTEDRVAYAVHHDQLTGLPNRRTFNDKLASALLRTRREEGTVAVLFVGLDRFKQVNDALGHEAGDRLLRQTGQRLLGAIREYDTVARLGGDEFAVLLENVEDELRATQVARRIAQALALPAQVGDVEIVVTGSIGVAVAPQAGLTAESLVRAADAALATAKVRGRSSIEIARSERRSDTSGLIRLSVDLRMALESRQFLLHYQPQVDLHTGRVDALEALLRWKRSDGRLVLPKDFIPALEDTGLIVDVGAWVIRTACAQAARWREEGQQGLRVAVNLSARQFENDGLVRTVEEALRETDIPAEMLELEITESLLMSDTLQTNAILGALKSIGVRIAVDDFGTGYSSLAYLERFNVDVLKIDRSFVASIQRGNGGGSVASAIVGLAHRLGLVAVAEGVETDEQLAHLRKSGCDGVQGYLFGKPAMPAPAHEYVALMARHAAVAGRA